MPKSRRGRAAPEVRAQDGSNRLALLVLALTVVLVYANSVRAPFIWDDATAVSGNQSIRSIGSAWSPPAESPVAGRPIPNVTLAVNYAVGELNPIGYHLVNIAVHVGCALLLFLIVFRSVESEASSFSLLVALLWAVHPLASEPVDYVTERTESVMAFFFLLTLCCSIRSRRSPRAGVWQIGAVVAAAAAMASKETAAPLPLVVVLYDWAFDDGSSATTLRRRPGFYGALAATWVVVAALALGEGRSTVTVTGAITPYMYALNQVRIVAHYLWLVVWPRALVLDYGVPTTVSWGDIAWPAVIIVVILAAAAAAAMRSKRVAFLAGAAVLTLAPSSSIVPVLTEVGAERRMYLPLAAIVALAVAALCRLPASRLKVHACLIAIAVALAVRTIARNSEYDDPVALWRTTVERWPSGRARYSLGTALVEAGRHDEGIAELWQAAPDFPAAHFVLGTEHYGAGRYAEAERETRAFIDADPGKADRVPGHVLLGEIALAENRLEPAAAEFRRVLAAEPGNAVARKGVETVAITYRNQGARRLEQSDPRAAADDARAALALSPNDAAAHNLLGAALATEGDIDAARAEFERAVAIDPSNQQARNNLERARRAASNGRDGS